MLHKTCTKCKIKKPLAEFSKKAATKDGLRCWCRACVAIYDRSPHRTEARRRYAKRYYQTQRGKESWRRRAKKSQQKYPEKKKARNIVTKAVQSGKIKRSVFCEECGLPAKTEGHHEDYSKPLDVDWLCIKCHTKNV